ncbi:MAG: hypothetical protein ACRDTD_13805 [Pseudonocardiaceae bacterium]
MSSHEFLPASGSVEQRFLAGQTDPDSVATNPAELLQRAPPSGAGTIGEQAAR